MDLNDHHVVSLTLGPVEHSPEQVGCPEYYVRKLSWITDDGQVNDLNLFAHSGPECLTLLGEKPAEARLDAYADQARQTNTEKMIYPQESCLPDTQGEVDLAAEANPPKELPF